MNKQEVGFDSSSFLMSLGSSLDLIKVTTENIDNAIQHGGKDILVIVDEQSSTITVYEQGSGFTPASWRNYHTIAGCPVNTLGCSKYNIGSKAFHYFADYRSVHSIGADNTVYRSMWESGKTSYDTFDESINELGRIKDLVGLEEECGTAVALGGVNFESYKTASSFAAQLYKTCEERYQSKLHNTGKTLGILYINNNGFKEDPKIVEPRNFQNYVESGTLTTKTVDGIKVVTFVDSDSSRYVSEQGIDVFYDDILIDKLQWVQYTSKQGLQTKASHYIMNNARQFVFLTPQNSEGVSIDFHKTNCSLPMSVQKRLASDLTSLMNTLNTQRVKKAVKTPVPSKTKTVNQFVVEDRSTFFNRPDNMDLPFAKNSKTNEVYINSDSAFFDKFVDKSAKERTDWVAFIDAMFEIQVKRGKKQSDMNFIKEVSQHFNSKI